MKFVHDSHCLADRCCYGQCIHDPVTGARIDPVEVTMEITPFGEMIYKRLRNQEIHVPAAS